MFTPRRLLFLLMGFVVCFGAYEVYAFFLGHYDGLPPLPPEYRQSGQSAPRNTALDEDHNRTNRQEIAKLLEKAFGPKCPELSRSRKIEIGKPESRTVFAFDDWTLEDGGVRMTKVSAANFKKIPAEGKLPEREEIVTLQGDTVVIKFNQPIKSLFEFKSNVKPIAGHIEGEEIKLTHNHGTPDRNDDVAIYCKHRIDFVDEQKRVWSDGKVLVVYADPLEAKFEGVGLEILLASELVNKNTDAAKTKGDKKDEGLGISSVKSIKLERDVEFTFLKLQGSLLGGAVGKPGEKKEASVPAQPMVIRCKDAFTYDVQGHQAIFLTNVNALRHRTIATPTGPKQQYDELDADERLVLELLPPAMKKKEKGAKLVPDEDTKQFELKKAVATGKRVKISANEDGQGNGLQAEGIELICDNVAHEARLRGKDQVIAKLMEYDIVAQGTVKILLPIDDAQDKDPRGLIINGPGEVRLRPSAAHPDPYTLASWQRELQWHRTAEEHRIELLGNAVLMHEKHGRMAGDQVKAWLVPNKTKPDDKNKPATTISVAGNERLDARLKRVEVDQRVSLFSTRLVIPQANRLMINFIDAPEGFVFQKLNDGFDAPAPASQDKNASSTNMLGKPDPKQAAAPVNTPPIYLNAVEIDADILVVSDKMQLIKRVEARDNVHIERKSDPGKQNGIDIHGQRLEMTLQGNAELYRVKLFGSKATITTDRFGVEGQQIDLDQTENRVTIPGPGKFQFMTDRDFQGNMLIEGRDMQGQPLKDQQGNIKIKPEQVTFVWDERMEFGGRAAQFVGSVIAEKGDINLRCYSMTITLDKPMSLSGKEDLTKTQTANPTVALESVVCVSNTQVTPGQRVNPVVIEQRIKPGLPDRHILRIEGVQVAFDNSRKDHELIKVYGPGEVNLVRAGKNQLGNFGGMKPAAGQVNGVKPQNDDMQLKLTRVLFEQELEYIKSEGKLRFWRNVRTFHVPGDDVSMPLDEKRLPKEGLYIACEKMEISAVTGPNKTTLHEMQANDNVELRANLTSYIKGDILTYSEAKGQVVIRGAGANDALAYNQDRPGGKYVSQSAKAFIYDMKTGILDVEKAKSLQLK